MRTKNLTVLIFSALFLSSIHLTSEAAELTVTVTLPHPHPEGTVIFSLFDNANAFGGVRDPTTIVKFPLDGRKKYRLKDITPGNHALMAYFDENNNGRLDKTFIGIPKEPLGFSNNYQPKGPPSYSRAVFMLAQDEIRHFDVTLSKPLGKMGQIGIGAGTIIRTSPYRKYNGGVYQPLPTITYLGERLQIYGPNLKFGFIGTGKVRIAATGSYRMGVYEEDDSDFLAGLGDRKDTLMAGLAIEAELPGGFDLFAGYQHDVLNEIGGGAAQIGIKRSFQLGMLRFSPNIAINWLSANLSNYDFGVEENKAKPERPAYLPGETFSAEFGLGLSIELAEKWLFFANSNIELFNNKVIDSPIVSEDYVIKSFSGLGYIF